MTGARLVAILPDGEVIVTEGTAEESWQVVGSDLTLRDAAYLAKVAAGWVRRPETPPGSPQPAPKPEEGSGGHVQLRCSESCPLWVVQLGLADAPGRGFCADTGEAAPKVCYPAYVKLAEELDRARRRRQG